MGAKLSKQSYGKSTVCLSYIERGEGRHEFTQIAVNVALEGDFDAAYTDGDNLSLIHI